MTYDVDIAGRTASVTVRAHPLAGWLVTVDDGPEQHICGSQQGAAEWHIETDQVGRRIAMVVHGEAVAAQLRDGTGVLGTVVDPRDHALEALSGGSEGAVSTPMPGAIVRVLVEPGQSVEAGQVLVVVEAMKMENEFKAPRAGVVEAVHVEAGTSVESGALLVTVAEPA